MAGGLLFQEGVLALLGASPEEPAVYEMAKSYTFYIFPGIPFQILTVVLATYIRNDNAETLSIILQAMSGIGNLIISALLLMGFGWGIEGCSFGFFLANLVTFALGLGYICLGRGQLRLRGKAAGFRESFKALRLQLTLLAREDGTFELHLRDNGEKLNPFQLARAALSRKPERVGELSQGTSGLALHMVKSHASNLFYRTSQGFNTLTLSI